MYGPAAISFGITAASSQHAMAPASVSAQLLVRYPEVQTAPTLTAEYTPGGTSCAPCSRKSPQHTTDPSTVSPQPCAGLASMAV